MAKFRSLVCTRERVHIRQDDVSYLVILLCLPAVCQLVSKSRLIDCSGGVVRATCWPLPLRIPLPPPVSFFFFLYFHIFSRPRV